MNLPRTDQRRCLETSTRSSVPSGLFNGSLTYYHRDLAEVSLGGRYVSESFLELTNQADLTLPSFFVANLQVTVRFAKKHSFTFQANNIFDELYFTNGAPVDTDFDGISEPGYLVQPPRHYLWYT